MVVPQFVRPRLHFLKSLGLGSKTNPKTLVDHKNKLGSPQLFWSLVVVYGPSIELESFALGVKDYKKNGL